MKKMVIKGQHIYVKAGRKEASTQTVNELIDMEALEMLKAEMLTFGVSAKDFDFAVLVAKDGGVGILQGSADNGRYEVYTLATIEIQESGKWSRLKNGIDAKMIAA